MPKIFNKAASGLDWLQRIQTLWWLWSLLVSGALWKGADAALGKFTAVPPEWRTPLALLVAAAALPVALKLARKVLPSRPWSPQEIAPPDRPPVAISPATPIVPAMSYAELLRQDQPGGERIFTDVSIEKLISIVWDPNLTTVQQQKLLEPQLGKWKRLDGSLGDLSAFGDGWSVTFRDAAGLLHVYTPMRFAKKWGERLLLLNSGDPLSIIGQITEINKACITFENCELVMPSVSDMASLPPVRA